jgi:hypothetical protein
MGKAPLITRNMPSALSESQEQFPGDMIGATILEIGQPADLKLEGGGLSILYMPRGQQNPKRIDLEFTELGMWIHEATNG